VDEDRSLRAQVAIVGVGETPVGKVPTLSSMHLHAHSLLSAVADAGIELNDVDALITGNSRHQPYQYHADALAEYLGFTPRHALSVNTGGSTTGQLLAYAAGLIATGSASTVAIVMADNLATGMGRQSTIESMATMIGHPDYEFPYHPTVPAMYALFAQRYMWEYSIAAEKIAEVAVVDRYHAALHGSAHFTAPLTVDDVLSSRLICDPVHLLECAPVSDGGCAIIVTSNELREINYPRPIFLLGYGEARTFEHVSQAPTLTYTAATISAPTAYSLAHVGPEDIDVAMVYDAFAFIQCMQLEDLGFCEKGEGADFVASGATRLGGQLPVNTHGGLLSHSHAGRPSTLFMIIEAVNQLRGECGERQVSDAKLALVHSEGGVLGSHCTLIFGNHRP